MVPIDFFLFCGSTYTYLTVMRIDDAAAKAGVEVRWRPFNLRAIMTEQNNIPFANKPVKLAYMWRDVGRRARSHGLDWRAIPPYPIDKDLHANLIAQLAAEEGWCADYVKAAYQAWIVGGVPLGAPGTLEPVLQSIGQEPARVRATASSDRVRKNLEAATDDARRLGIFGAPTFAVGSEIFWGDDRLDDALTWARGRAQVGSEAS